MRKDNTTSRTAERKVGDYGCYEERDFLKLWGTVGLFPGPAAVEARWGLLNAMEQRNLTVMQWNWVGQPTRKYIAWLLEYAKYYLAVSIKSEGADRNAAQRIWPKALHMAVKNITQLPFNQDQDLYVDLLKILDNHKIYPEFWKEPYARHVKKFLDIYHHQWRDLKSDMSFRRKAIWQENYENNRYYWYMALVMSCNLRSAVADDDRGMIVALKSHLALFLQIIRGKKGKPLTLAGMLKTPETQLDGKTPIPLGVWSRDLLLRIGRSDDFDDILFGL